MKSNSKTILAIVLLILFFPAGLFVMWKQTNWNKTAKWIVTGIFGLVLLLIMAGGKGSSATSTTEANSQPTQSISVIPTKPAQPLTLTQQLWIALDNAMQTRDGYKIDYDASSKTATITSSVEEAWDENALVRGSYTALVKYGREAFKLKDVDAIRVIVRTKFTDQYGNDNWGDAVRIIMSKEQFSKFNWDNLKDRPVSEQIQNAADGYYVAPGIDAKTTPDKLYLSL